jgi:gluconolactonase
MKITALLVPAWCLLGCAFVFGQGGGVANPAPAADTVAPAIPGVVAAGTKVQLIKEGFQGAQGATAAPDGSLLFTERMANRITRIDSAGTISSYMENTSAANSFAFDRKGRVLAVQWMPAQVAALAPDKATLADKCDGHVFGRPNDLVIDKKGGAYITDDLGKPADGIKPGVYYVSRQGKTTKITDDIARPNGLELSRNGKILYVDDTNGDAIRAFDVQSDGSATNERVFAKITEGVKKADNGTLNSGADGATIDNAGRLYVSTNTGVQVFSPDGKYLGAIPIPKQTNNLAFAGANKKTLYVLAGNAVYKIDMLTPGYKGRLK